jgi:hypothetical protein
LAKSKARKRKNKKPTLHRLGWVDCREKLKERDTAAIGIFIKHGAKPDLNHSLRRALGDNTKCGRNFEITN